MKNKPKVKKGSSLVVVLLVFSILTILGTSMLSLTLMSYKRRSAETRIKANLYMSESALAEAYSIVGKYVDKAFEEGSKNVENELAILLDAEKQKLQNGGISEYIDTDGNIIPEKIEAFKNEKFTTTYKAYIKNKIVKLKIDLKAQGNYSELKVNSTTAEKPIITIIEDKSSTDFILDEYKLVLESTFNLDNFKKTIQTTYVIKVPKYSNLSNSASKIIRLTQNPVWTKAICADGDMKIQNGTVNINGDIYIKGNEPTGTNKDVGIILSNKVSKLLVTGNVATSKNLETTYNEDLSANAGSEIVVNGNIYAKNMIISKEESEDYGAKGAKITTNNLTGTTSDGSLYVMDDMEVNAEKSTVNISGGFYGVSDGSQAANNNPDNSSSIIVNAEDIGNTNGSTINIGKEAYIAGSAYVSGLKYGAIDDYKYQTGESVSIKGNYKAYTQPLKNDHNIVKSGEETNLKDDTKFEYYDPLTLASKYRYFKSEEVSVFIENINDESGIQNTDLGVHFSDIGKTNNVDAKGYRICYDIGKDIWTSATPIDLPVEIPMIIAEKTQMKLQLLNKSGTSLGEVKDISVLDYKSLNVFDKSEYFKDYYTDYGTESELNLGQGITIGDMAKSIYIASIFSGSSTNKQILTSNYNTDGDLKIITKRNELKDQLFYMGFYNKFEGDSSTGNIPDNINSPQKTVVSQVNFDSHIFKKPTTLEMVQIENGIEVIDQKKYVNSSKDVTILNGDVNKSYAFIEEGGSEVGIPNTPSDKIYYKPSVSGTTFNGIIVTKGDLYLSGNINFIGTIICGGTIYFTDNTLKTFTYDDSYVKNNISNNYSIFKDVFRNPLSSKNDIYVDVFQGNRSFVKTSMLEMRDWVIIK
jgi:Tfp pilus assembly protein PilX